MRLQPVALAIKVLLVLYEVNPPTSSVNKVFQKTGSKDKPLVIESIKLLERANLVKSDEARHYTQKKVKALTDLGRTFAEFIINVRKYNESYDSLKQVIKQNFNMPSDKNRKILVRTLRARGWDAREASRYKVFYTRTMLLLSYLSPHQNIDAILTRYISLLSQSDIIGNEVAMAVLNRVVMDLLSEQISFIQEDITDTRTNLQYDEDEGQERELFDYVSEQKIDGLDYIFAHEKSLESRFTNEEAKRVLLAILNIFKPSKKALNHFPYKTAAIGEVVSRYFEGS